MSSTAYNIPSVTEPVADQNKQDGRKASLGEDLADVVENADASTEAKIQLEKKRQYNRENAARARQRTKNTLESLRSKVELYAEKNLTLERDGEVLKKANSQLQLENVVLRQQLQERLHHATRLVPGTGTMTGTSIAATYQRSPQESLCHTTGVLSHGQQGRPARESSVAVQPTILTALSTLDNGTLLYASALSDLSRINNNTAFPSLPGSTSNLLTQGLPLQLLQFQNVDSSNSIQYRPTTGSRLELGGLFSGSSLQQASSASDSSEVAPSLSPSSQILSLALQSGSAGMPATATKPSKKPGSRSVDQKRAL